MDQIIIVYIRERIACVVGDALYVCGNSGYTVHFVFDSEWNEYAYKTARFIVDDGTYVDVVFDGNEVKIPVLFDTYRIRVGVSAGNLRTTTRANISCKKSILCGSGTPAVPPDDQYAQMMENINSSADRAENAAQRAEDIAEALAGGESGSGGGLFLPSVSGADNGKVLTVENGQWVAGEGGVNFRTNETLILENGILSVNTAHEPDWVRFTYESGVPVIIENVLCNSPMFIEFSSFQRDYPNTTISGGELLYGGVTSKAFSLHASPGDTVTITLQ